MPISEDAKKLFHEFDLYCGLAERGLLADMAAALVFEAQRAPILGLEQARELMFSVRFGDLAETNLAGERVQTVPHFEGEPFSHSALLARRQLLESYDYLAVTQALRTSKQLSLLPSVLDRCRMALDQAFEAWDARDDDPVAWFLAEWILDIS